MVTVVSVAALAYSHFTVSLKEHQQALDDAKSSYNDTKSQLEELNTKLTNTQSKIKELESYNKLSFTDQQDLESLQKENNKLERQIDLLNQEKKVKQDLVNQNFASTMKSDVGKSNEYTSKYKYENVYSGVAGGYQVQSKKINEMDYANEEVDDILKSDNQTFKSTYTILDELEKKSVIS